ncbi:hypothetical protein PTTG_06544 [Puccinia triticina 1-1 BBBD Race 1]|uniref:Uncharacterized protein n=1 Tax=Puccinia triticina (isolate 1-1 / race 1 (BBBD)) TaxID=630390 RepID=A0A180GEF7_PUCT1|nr:hypothetical protein PTTG_06544 [Puccinia triticina 1-1 BBBD Race 1]
MSESISKNSVPKAPADKLSDLPTLAGGTANSTATAMTQPLPTGDNLPLTSAGEASQVEAQSIEESLVPQAVEPVTGPAKNTWAKANPAAKQKKSAKKQLDQSEKQAAPKAPRLPADDLVDDPEQEILELLVAETPPVEKTVTSNDNRDAIWLKANEADNDGDVERANFFYNMYASIVNNSKITTQSAIINGTSTRPSPLSSLIAVDPSPVPAPPPTTSKQVSVGQSEAKSKQKGLSFKIGCENQHVSVGFTPFFDKNLKELKAPIPLT